MGVYWKWVCPDRGEHLDPDALNESDKHPMENTMTLRVLAWLCQYGSWSGRRVELVSDAITEIYYGEHLAPPGTSVEDRCSECWWRDPPDLQAVIEVATPKRG